MLLPPKTLLALFEPSDTDLLVLTPNKRLSRFVQDAYSRFKLAQGEQSWPTFPCYSLNAWLQSLWEDWSFEGVSAPDKLLMSASQESLLWQQVVGEHSDLIDLFNPVAAADMAKKARNTLQQWMRDPVREEDLHEAFVAWNFAYQTRCEEGDLIEFSAMVDAVIGGVKSREIDLPRRLVLLAFDDITPQAKQLLELAQEQGCRVEYMDNRLEASACQRTSLGSSEAEVRAAAYWAAHHVSVDPTAKIGIVIPQLNQERERIESVFTQVFEPQYILPDQDRHATPFNMSAAVPLAQTPVIAHAILALELNLREIAIDDVSRILHSPFIGEHELLTWRSALDASLRRLFLKMRTSQFRVSVGEFGVAARDSLLPQADADNGDDAGVLNAFYQQLQSFHALARGGDSKRAPSHWAQLFCEQLTVLGWPGTRALDTLEYQQADDWNNLVAQLNHLDYMFPSISLERALGYLTQFAKDTPFQAQTTDSPVQVLGVFEAAGLLFDKLWVVGLDNESWPAPVKPNPLLPTRLQALEKMPLASAEKELALAKRLTERFCHCANQVVFSHSEIDGDKKLQASALIESLPFIEASALAGAGRLSSDDMYLHDSPVVLEHFADNNAMPIVAPEEVRGGTQILKDQAACPFRAFAKHRLAARVSEDAVAGLSAATRGSLIHNVLDLFWQKIHTQARLIALEDTALDTEINTAIEQSFAQLPREVSLGTNLRALEAERMLALVRAWLELEKQRAPFSVAFRERSKTLTLSGLPIKIRYDRVDVLEDGSLFVIDYKTGKQALKTWAGDRPDEPQVPMYSIADQEKISGAAFGQIHVDEIAIKGISENTGIAPGIKAPEEMSKQAMPPSWQGIVEHWHSTLESLAQEFINGQADVAPKLTTVTCQYCDLQSLCRIKELSKKAQEHRQENSLIASEGGV